MKTAKIRDYSKLMERLQKSWESTMIPILTLGEISVAEKVYPLFKVVLGKGNSRRALILAGIHGDEPAGVEAIIEFLESKRYSKFIHDWEITLLPCLNPWGYEHAKRENHEMKDLNREFKSTFPPLEVKLIQSVLHDPFDLALELHEDVESSGFYLYGEGKSGKEAELGRKILKRVNDIMPINRNPEIEGNPAAQGIIKRPCGSTSGEWWPMAVYTLAWGTKECFTLETSIKFSMKARVSAHLLAIETALQFS
jgi:murein peptide amidase A